MHLSVCHRHNLNVCPQIEETTEAEGSADEAHKRSEKVGNVGVADICLQNSYQFHLYFAH
jgi:hypothetical protein